MNAKVKEQSEEPWSIYQFAVKHIMSLSKNLLGAGKHSKFSAKSRQLHFLLLVCCALCSQLVHVSLELSTSKNQSQQT